MRFPTPQFVYIFAAGVVLTIILTVGHSFATESAPVKLSCKQEKGVQWFVKKGDLTIGGPDYSVDKQERCENLIKNTKNNMVCSWNGYTFQFYDIRSGKALGVAEPQKYWSKEGDCISSLQLQADKIPVHCNWNGKYYAPLTFDNIQLSREKSGWENMKDCVEDSSSTYNAETVCGWDSGYYLYDLQGKKISDVFDKKERECSSFQNIVRQSSKSKNLYESMTKQEDLNRYKSATPDGSKAEQLGHCQVREHNYHLTKSKDGYIIPECAPDTLYSWGGFSKADWFIKNLPANQEWKTLPRSLYSTHSSAATFGYGSIPLRFKVKEGVKFKLFINEQNADSCEGYVKNNLAKSSELENTIFARLVIRNNGLSFLDYIICSGAVLNSWSFLTPEHYDEISLDYEMMTQQHFFNWEGYSKHSGKDLFLDNDIDQKSLGTDFSRETYEKRMSLIKKMTSSKLGQVVFQGTSSQNKLPEKTKTHFKTNHPNHFNLE